MSTLHDQRRVLWWSAWPALWGICHVRHVPSLTVTGYSDENWTTHPGRARQTESMPNRRFRTKVVNHKLEGRLFQPRTRPRCFRQSHRRDHS